MAYMLVSFFVLALSFFLFRKAAGSLSFVKPNLISYVFYYNVVVQTFIALVLAILYLDGHYVIGRVGPDVRHYAWLAVMYMMVAFPVGMLISKLIFSSRFKMSGLLNNYVASPISISGVSGNSLKYSVWCFTFISVLACIYTFWKIGYFPFFKAATSSPEELAVTRISVSRDFEGNVYVRNFFALTMMPMLAYVWVFYCLASRKKLDFLMASLSVMLATSILYYDFSKSPLLWYILSFVFVYYYGMGRFRVHHIIFLVSVVFFGLVMMYSLSGVSIVAFASYNSGPIGRVVLGQAAGLFVMFDIFPSQHDFIGLFSLSQAFSEFLGFEYTDRAARIAMMHFNPRGVEEGTAGVMNSIFIAEAWANFGLLGVLLSPIWVGFLLQTLYIFFLKSKKNPLFLALFVSFSFGGSVTGGFNDYIYNPGVVMMGVVFLMILMLANFFKGVSASGGRKVLAI